MSDQDDPSALRDQQTGMIQPHGVLLVVSEDSWLVTHASANVDDMIGWPLDDVLAKPLQSLLAVRQLELLHQLALAPPSPDLLKPWPCSVRTPNGGEVEMRCISQVHDRSIYLELFKEASGRIDEQNLRSFRQRMIDDLRRPDSIENACAAAVRMIRELTGYDRVMCYRFHDDAHGEVIAEDTDHDDRRLGFHYPASDLPDVARKHFERNQIRVITNVEAEQVPIVAAAGRHGDLDLTFVKLRGVTPVYRAYLRELGARATLSIPLVINDRLWGLIACHHEVPRSLPVASLHMAEVAGQMIAIFIEGQQNANRLQHLIKAQELAFAVGRRSSDEHDFIEQLTPFVSHMAELFGADSIVTRVDGQWTPLHGWKGDEVDFTPLKQHLEDGVFIADRLGEYLSIADDLQKDLAGGVLLSVAEGDEDYLFLGRREDPHTVTWAGRQPNTDGSNVDGGSSAGESPVIEPQSSFAQWQEEVRGRSRPYLATDRETLAIVLQALRGSFSAYRDRRMIAAQAEMEALQAELRLQLLNNAGLASMGELAAALAHELNQPLTAISNFVNACRQMIRSDDIAVPKDLVALMDDAVSESQRAGEIVRRLRNFVQQGELERGLLDISKTVADTVRLALSAKKTEPVELVTDLADDLPPILADQVQIQQVVFNLVRNSIEAMAAADQRILTLRTRQPDGTAVEVLIEDTGTGVPAALLPTLFQPFRTSKPEGMGIGLSLCRSIIETHGGRITCENIEIGARFRFTLPIARK